MRLSTWVLAQMTGLCLLRAQNVPAQGATSQQSPFEAVPEPRQSRPLQTSGPTIKAIEFRGANRILQSALRAIILTRVGDAYDVEALQTDSRALYNTRRFAHVVWEAEPGPAGTVVRFVLVERPLIEAIEVQGDNSVTLEEILERFRQRKAGLRVDTLLDEDELSRAALAVEELLTEKGRTNFVVTSVVERIGPPSIARITFKVAEKR